MQKLCVTKPAGLPSLEISVHPVPKTVSLHDLGIAMESMQTFGLHLCAAIFICTECDALPCRPTNIWQLTLIYALMKYNVCVNYLYTYTVTTPGRPRQGQGDDLSDFNY